jgi:hypothetical protein
VRRDLRLDIRAVERRVAKPAQLVPLLRSAQARIGGLALGRLLEATTLAKGVEQEVVARNPPRRTPRRSARDGQPDRDADGQRQENGSRRIAADGNAPVVRQPGAGELRDESECEKDQRNRSPPKPSSPLDVDALLLQVSSDGLLVRY